MTNHPIFIVFIVYGWNMSLVWTTLLAVVFFVITPAAIVFLVCYNSHLNVLRRSRRSREDAGTMEDPPNVIAL
jgi:hypothetical protein